MCALCTSVPWPDQASNANGGMHPAGSSAAEACYRASHKLLLLAGVELRQHKLARPVLLGEQP